MSFIKVGFPRKLCLEYKQKSIMKLKHCICVSTHLHLHMSVYAFGESARELCKWNSLCTLTSAKAPSFITAGCTRSSTGQGCTRLIQHRISETAHHVAHSDCQVFD